MAFAEDIHKHKHSKLKNVGPDDHHRKWGLFDEPSWIRTLYLPLGTWTKVGVSLISLGGWHVSWVSHPRVIFNEADDKYWVYFAGGNTNRSIGLAKGTSLKSALTEITDGIGGTSRVLDASGIGGAFDETGVSYPAVIYDPLDVAAKRWKMLFNGRNAAGQYADIGYAYSSDGKSWTKSASNPVIDLVDICEASTLVRAGNKFYALYRRAGGMYASYSDDCVTWTEWGSVLNVGAGGAWDDNSVAYPTLYFDQGTWYMCYGGHDGTYYRTGLALSQKFWESAWFKLPYNPVLSEPSPKAAVSGCLIRMEDEFLMVYESNDPNRAIRSATIP